MAIGERGWADRRVPTWAAGLIGGLSADVPTVVTRENIDGRLTDAGNDRDVDSTINELRRLGWLVGLPIHGVWAFIPPGQDQLADPYTILRGGKPAILMPDSCLPEPPPRGISAISTARPINQPRFGYPQQLDFPTAFGHTSRSCNSGGQTLLKTCSVRASSSCYIASSTLSRGPTACQRLDPRLSSSNSPLGHLRSCHGPTSSPISTASPTTATTNDSPPSSPTNQPQRGNAPATCFTQQVGNREGSTYLTFGRDVQCRRSSSNTAALAPTTRERGLPNATSWIG